MTTTHRVPGGRVRREIRQEVLVTVLVGPDARSRGCLVPPDYTEGDLRRVLRVGPDTPILY